MEWMHGSTTSSYANNYNDDDIINQFAVSPLAYGGYKDPEMDFPFPNNSIHVDAPCPPQTVTVDNSYKRSEVDRKSAISLMSPEQERYVDHNLSNLDHLSMEFDFNELFGEEKKKKTVREVSININVTVEYTYRVSRFPIF